ncbi:MAG: hypothetical protein K9K79_13020 [Desulfohalobiaceae bacterium]|nr:hypothetical protein [Desulfohalobiaceae bacterium]
MPLTNFGSILKFAEDLETQDHEFYLTASQNPKCTAQTQLFEAFASDLKKNQKVIQRIRRENVTEMILEPVEGLTRSEFCVDLASAKDLDEVSILENARQREDRAKRYYQKAAEQIKAQPEVARGLKQIAKKRDAHLEKLQEFV